MIKTLKNYIKKKIFEKRTKLEFKKKNTNIINKSDLKYFIKSFGKENKDKIFYVIQRSPGGGLFSNLNYVIHHLYICEKHNFIPVIDMENFLTKYNSKQKFNNKYNSWEYYFSKVSKYNLKNVYKSRNVIITDSKTRKLKCFDSFANLDTEHYKVFKKYIRINKNILKKVEKFKNKYFKNNKVLGVHFRGTDMKYQERHPFPPTLKQIKNVIDHNLKKYKFNKIFLVTEEFENFNNLRSMYNDKIIFHNSFRSIKTDIFDNNRKYHRPRIGEENLIDMLLLKDTSKIICSNSHLPDASLYFNKKLEKNIQYIENGYNSNNMLIAQFLWKIKNVLPKFLGGFD